MKEFVLHSPLPGVLFVRVATFGSGPALLAINGLSRPVESWEPFANALPTRRLITFDAPGIGGSPRSLFPLTIATLALLTALVADFAGEEIFDLLGYSHGGAVAQQLAIATPSRVRRLVLAATTPGAGAPVGDVSSLAQTHYDDSWPSSDATSIAWRTIALASWSSLPMLSNIAAPTLIVVGDEDPVIPAATTALLMRGIPHPTLHILKADHDLQTPRVAKEFARTTDDFLSESLEQR